MSNPNAAHGRAILLYILITLTSNSCTNDAGSPSQPRTVGYPSYSYEGCWPISETCQDQALSDTDANRVDQAISSIDEWGDPRCGNLIQQLMIDFSAGRIRHWTVGPEIYDPANYYGDRHNGPSVTHITSNALATNQELKNALIHEAAHAFGYSDTVADELVAKCGGLPE
ncbi:MAG TPA: hypothetical protein VJ755_10130 [Gemmatimonadales bacterium]|nr:hypothetical protein [Gemmatimonadales bacterium]